MPAAAEGRTREPKKPKESKTETSSKSRKSAPVEPTTSKDTSHAKREIYYAPESAVEVIAPFIRDFKGIWDPASRTI